MRQAQDQSGQHTLMLMSLRWVLLVYRLLRTAGPDGGQLAVGAGETSML